MNGRLSAKPSVAGGGSDFTLQTGANLISTATGSFPAVTGVTSVQSVNGCQQFCGPNAYTLQINSEFFQTAACNGQRNCLGWEQFVYYNPTGSSQGVLFIQDWLISDSSCPTGWNVDGGDCYRNSPTSVAVPNQSIVNLGSLVETGTAASSGDSIYLSVGNAVYAMKNIQSDGLTDLSLHWNGVQFNVIGDSGGAQAVFNSGASVTASIQANDGVTSAPTCEGNSGYTGESNNLTDVAAPPATMLPNPSILYKESNVSGSGSASCSALGSLSSTSTWHGLPGLASSIGVGSVFAPVVISTIPNGPGYEPFQWSGSPSGGSFSTELIGGAIETAVSPQGTVYVVNSANQIFQYNSTSTTTQLPGAARRISAGPSATSFYVIGTDPMGPAGNYGIHFWNGSSYTQIPGSGTDLSISPDGTLWVLAADLSIFRANSAGGFDGILGAALDIAAAPNGRAYVIGKNAYGPAGNYAVYYFNGTTFSQIPGAYGVRIAVMSDGVTLFTLSADKTIRALF